MFLLSSKSDNYNRKKAYTFDLYISPFIQNKIIIAMLK